MLRTTATEQLQGNITCMDEITVHDCMEYIAQMVEICTALGHAILAEDKSKKNGQDFSVMITKIYRLYSMN